MTFDSSGFSPRGAPAVVEVAESAVIRRRPTDAAAGIELRGVTHRYVGQSGAVYALEPIDLEVEAGSFVAILGPSGCGKTTLLRIVSGLLESTGGQDWLATIRLPRRPNCCSASGSTTTAVSIRTSCRAACGSASRWRVRSSRGRRFC